jgi:hypothetical protein
MEKSENNDVFEFIIGKAANLSVTTLFCTGFHKEQGKKSIDDHCCLCTSANRHTRYHHLVDVVAFLYSERSIQ